MAENFNKTEQTAWLAWVRATQQVMEEIELEIARKGYPPLPWYDALLELDRAPAGRLRLSELGERMLLKKFNVTRLIDRLEKMGLAERTPCDSDARGAYAVITPKGRKRRQSMWPCYRDAVRKNFLGKMSENEQQLLIRLTKRFVSGRVRRAPRY